MSEEHRIYRAYAREILKERRLVRRIERLTLVTMAVIAVVVVWML